MKFTPNENILRIALIAFSVLFGILSVSLIALGIVYVDELWWPRRYIGLDFIELPTLLIVLGCISLTMSIAGCFCAKSYNRVLLLVFAGILFTILCLELSIAVIAFINFDEHEGRTKTHRVMLQQYNSADEETRLFFEKLEEKYYCCGVTGKEENCTNADEMTAKDIIFDLNVTVSPDDVILSITGCADAVDLQIQLIAAEIGYFNVVLAVLQVIEIGYVLLIRQSLKEYRPA